MGDNEYTLLLARIKDGDAQALKSLFDTYYVALCRYATKIIHDGNQAEEIVQGLFVKIWENRQTLQVNVSLKSYLYQAVRNQCLNALAHEKIKQQHIQRIKEEQAFTTDIDEDDFFELHKRIEEGIAAMPTKRREIFSLSRREGLKYKEIAAKLNISVKTVEAQMGLALKGLREFMQNKS